MRTQPFWRQAFTSGDDDSVSGPFGSASVDAEEPAIYGEIIALNDAGTPGTTLPSYCWKEKRAKAGGQYTSDDTLIASGTIATCTLPAGYIATGLLYSVEERSDLDVGSIVKVASRGTFDADGLDEWYVVAAGDVPPPPANECPDAVTNVCPVVETKTVVTSVTWDSETGLVSAVSSEDITYVSGIWIEKTNCETGEKTCTFNPTDCCADSACPDWNTIL